MADKIRVLIVDDLPETRENVRKLLQFEPDIEVIGQASNGEQAIAQAKEFIPDVVLMDINMPGIDGIEASRTIRQSVPQAQIVIMSVQSESDYLRRAMLAGARDFLTKPFSPDELATAIRKVHSTRPAVTVASPTRSTTDTPTTNLVEATEEGKVITVYSPKGGTGCTTVAINVAVSLARRGLKTVLMDGSLQFGDVAVMLDLKTTNSIVDLIERINELDADLIGSVTINHKSSLEVLLAPPRPEMAEYVTAEHIQTLVARLREIFDFIIIDTSSTLNDLTLSLLDTADRVLLVTQQSLPSLVSASRFFDLTEDLDYDPQKVMLVVNRASNKLGISIKDVSSTLKRPVVMAIPVDEPVVNRAADQGVPLVISSQNKHPVSMALRKLSSQLAEGLRTSSRSESNTQADTEKSSRFSRLFGGR